MADVDRQVRKEEDREDAVRDGGLQVVRYGTADAVLLDDLVDRARRAHLPGDRARVTARVRLAPRTGGR